MATRFIERIGNKLPDHSDQDVIRAGEQLLKKGGPSHQALKIGRMSIHAHNGVLQPSDARRAHNQAAAQMDWLQGGEIPTDETNQLADIGQQTPSPSTQISGSVAQHENVA